MPSASHHSTVPPWASNPFHREREGQRALPLRVKGTAKSGQNCERRRNHAKRTCSRSVEQAKSRPLQPPPRFGSGEMNWQRCWEGRKSKKETSTHKARMMGRTWIREGKDNPCHSEEGRRYCWKTPSLGVYSHTHNRATSYRGPE